MEVTERILDPTLHEKIMDPEEAIKNFVPKKATIAFSGITLMGAPKLFPQFLKKYAEESGINYYLNILTNGSAPPEIDSSLAKYVKRRYCYQNNPIIRKLINDGKIHYTDMGLNDFNKHIKYGIFENAVAPIDLAVIEATAVTEGGVVPSLSVDFVPTIVNRARGVIVEINISRPNMEGIHDIPLYSYTIPSSPIPITKVSQRIGSPYIRIPRNKILAIIESSLQEKKVYYGEISDIEKKIAENIVSFLEEEIKLGRLPKSLYPLQTGVGPAGDAVAQELLNTGFKNLRIWTEVMSCYYLDSIEEGKIKEVSASTLYIPPYESKYFTKLAEKIDNYKKVMVLRPTDITNSCETVSRLGVISINQAVETDIYGFINSTHVLGGKVVNGIGGSSEIAHASYLSIFALPSTAKKGKISRIVPMVTHVDTPDHDVDVVVTEWGWADLREKSPYEKAIEIIEKCAHPDYRDELLSYLNKANIKVGGHMPHLLSEAFSMHLRYMKYGSMK